MPKKTTYVLLNQDYKRKIISFLYQHASDRAELSSRLRLPYLVIKRFEKGHRAKIYTLLMIIKFLKSHGCSISIQEIEKNVIWIGGKRGPGINSPKLPFRFNTPSAAKLAAAFNSDGTIERNTVKRGHVSYYNEEGTIRKLVIQYAKDVFGDIYTREVQRKDGGHYVELSAISGDSLKLVGIPEGSKAKANPHIPPNVMKSCCPEIWWNYLQQSFDDEATVEFMPFKTRRAFTRGITKHCSVDVTDKIHNFITKTGTYLNFREVPSSIKPEIMATPPNLLVDEQILLKKFGIHARIYPKTLYCAKDGVRIIWELRLTDRESLTNFWKNIGFNHPAKAEKLNTAARSYISQKSSYFGKRGQEEVLRKALKACESKGYFTTWELATEINRSYQTAKWWVHRLEKFGRVRNLLKRRPFRYCVQVTGV